MVSGHVARGIYVNNPTANVGYRNNATKGRAKNDEPEAMYMVVDATRFSTIWQCAVRGPADEVERQRPAGYSPMKKRGAIILGTGGDGSNYGQGTFFEGAITSGNPSDATDDAVQANIVAAGYGR